MKIIQLFPDTLDDFLIQGCLGTASIFASFFLIIPLPCPQNWVLALLLLIPKHTLTVCVWRLGWEFYTWLTHLTLKSTLGGRYHKPYFIDEAEEFSNLPKVHSYKRWHRDTNSNSLAPESVSDHWANYFAGQLKEAGHLGGPHFSGEVTKHKALN